MASQTPTIQFRKGNANQLSFIISSGDSLIVPGSDLAISAEIRASDVGRVIATVPLITIDADAGTIAGILPDLPASIYTLGLFFDYTEEPDFRVGVAELDIVPTGRLQAVADATGLNIQISEVNQILRVALDNTPTAAIAAFYAQQVRDDATTASAQGTLATEKAADAAASATAANNSQVSAAGSATTATSQASQVATIKSQIDAIKSVIDGIQADIATKSGQVSANKTASDTTKTAIDGIKTAIDTIYSTIQGIQTDVTAKDANVTTNKGATDATKSAIDGIKTAIDTIYTAIQGIQTDITTKQNSVSSNKTAVDTTKGQIDTINTSIQTIKGQIDTIYSAIQAVQTDVTTRQTDVTTKQSAVNTTKGQIDTIYLDIQARQTDVTTKQGQSATSATNANTSAVAAAGSATAAAASAAAAVSSAKGAWNASTNTPALTVTPSLSGDYYDVTVAGNVAFAGSNFASGQAFAQGDQIKSNGTAWYRIPAVSKLIDPRLSPNLIVAANLTPDNLQVFPAIIDYTKPYFIKQSGNPVVNIVKNYLGFAWAAQYVLASNGDRVNFFSNRINVNQAGIAAGDSVFVGFFLYTPVGASLTVTVAFRQSTSGTGVGAPGVEQIALGNGWTYYRTTTAMIVPTVTDGLMEAGIYISNIGSASATVYIASPSLIKTATPLSPVMYGGSELIPTVPDVSGFISRDDLASTFSNPITDVDFASQTVGSALTTPWTVGYGGASSFAAPNVLVTDIHPMGNKALKVSSSKRSSDNFISDCQLTQVINVPTDSIGVTKMSVGFWIRRDSADISPSLFLQFFSATGGQTFISNLGVQVGSYSETLGSYFLAKFENITVPAGTKSIQITARTQYLSTSTVLDTIKYAYVSTPIVAMGLSKLLSLPYNTYEIASKAAAALIALQPSVDIPGSLAQAQFNCLKDANFATQTVGSALLTAPWTVFSGGNNRYQANYVVVNDLSPVGNRAVKITHNKRSSDSFASDIRIGQIITIPTEFVGATTMAVAVWLKRSSSFVGLLQGYFNFYSDAAGTVQISAASLGTISFTETAVGSYFLFRLNNIAVPAGTLAVQFSIRTNYDSTQVADTDTFLYLSTPIVELNVTAVAALPFNIDDRAKTIATTVFNQLIATAGGSSSIDKRKLSYGNRMRRTLSKLLSMSIDGQANVQNKRDDAIRIVHLGDSIVAQAWSSSYLVTGVTGSSDGRDFVGLEKKYPFANFSITNAGVGGQAAQHFKKHLWHQVLPYDPDLVVISTWGNDGMENWTSSTEQFYSSYEEILRYLRKHTTADIAICTYSLAPLSTRTYDNIVGSPGHKILLELSQKYDCELIDIARYLRDFGAKQTVPFYSNSTDITEWSNRAYWPAGDVHPNSTGQTVMAAAIAEHFPTTNDLLTDFDWNQGKTDWSGRRPVVQAESYFEYLDNSVRVSDESKWNVLATTSAEDYGLDSCDVLVSVNATADGEYVEFDFEGNALDLVYMQKTDGAAATILIDGVAPSSLSCAAIWFPDAESNNLYTATSKRDAMIRYVPGRWKVTEVLTITMTGTASALSTTYNLVGSVSGTLLTGISTAVATKVTLGDGSYLWIRPEHWYGRTTNIYTGDKFYIRVRNEQAIPLTSMRVWANGDRLFPLIDAPSTLNDEYMLRFAMTSATAFRVDIVRRQDRTGESVTMNVTTALGTGNVTDAGWSGGGFSITAAELTYVNGKAVSGNAFYYFVHRKFVDSITCLGASTLYKKVRIASFLTNGKHTVRITKSGTGKLYIDAIRANKPSITY